MAKKPQPLGISSKQVIPELSLSLEHKNPSQEHTEYTIRINNEDVYTFCCNGCVSSFTGAELLAAFNLKIENDRLKIELQVLTDRIIKHLK